MDLGRVGIWLRTDAMSANETAMFASEAEALGYGTLWIPEILGRHPFAQASWLLASTESLRVATGIANVLSRAGYVTAAAQKTLAEQSTGRFVLGLGVSHGPTGEAARAGETSERSDVSIGAVDTMSRYLDSLERAPYAGPSPDVEMPIVLAALGPRLLRLAAKRTDGAHTYLVPPEHTAMARDALGDASVLAVEQKVLLERNPSEARERGRAAIAFYLGLRNYQRSLERLGFEAKDWENGGSNRLVDSLVAWGDEAGIQRRLDEHFQAGASHICVQPVNPDGSDLPDRRVVRALAGYAREG